MKNPKSILTLILLCFIFFSYSSDDNDNIEARKNKAVKSKKASEIIKIDYTYNDDGLLSNATEKNYNNTPYNYVLNYNYDTNGRVIR
ncbi:hypothetical protein SY27_10325 [Flavobacterium sp. 316]|uniref:hypothetical protein n=1 Tax=Flavobacterium sp. 316 TaxID=1603293 RepID=UPI0005DD26FA|nr:hypothetical protein [Flavobacterium sp. 316]KIX21148.1 hypothetical protein SY27_10325 [Flavobacterium sp. 316]